MSPVGVGQVAGATMRLPAAVVSDELGGWPHG